jgi:ribosomal protein S18 acetylase RimI-like enzyme
MMLVRRAGETDIDAVAALFDAYRQFYGMRPDLAAAVAFLQARMIKSESVIFLAEDKVRGCLGFCQLYPTFCSVAVAPILVLYDLFVTPGGRNSGAGRALLASAERYGAEHGAVRMDLRTARTNLPAQSLYESSGWVRDEKFHSYSVGLGPA